MKLRHRITTITALVAAGLGASSLPALAQEFVKVDDAAREHLPAPQFVAAAYGFIWVALLGYVFFVARGLSRTQADIDEVRRRVDRATSGTDPR
ncbi:MAG TPA: CcmD family protein [Polyangia bacterium]|jgi:CcmD family protein|nr:CcmD family protein [Polyangia bacterium]